MSKRLVIFDLDGTLLDTIGDLADACNHVMQAHGYPTHSTDEYRRFVGNGINRLIERALPPQLGDASLAAQLRPEFIEYYNAHIDRHTVPYPGITDLLRELSDRRIMTAIASNKYIEGTRRLASVFFPQAGFIAVLGQRTGIPIKPDPHIVNEIMTIAVTTPDRTLYVGDSGVDMLTARNARVESVGVSWGFRPQEELVQYNADHIVNTADRILEFI